MIQAILRSIKKKTQQRHHESLTAEYPITPLKEQGHLNLTTCSFFRNDAQDISKHELPHRIHLGLVNNLGFTYFFNYIQFLMFWFRLQMADGEKGKTKLRSNDA